MGVYDVGDSETHTFGGVICMIVHICIYSLSLTIYRPRRLHIMLCSYMRQTGLLVH